MNCDEIWRSAIEELRRSPKISKSEFELRFANTRLRENADGSVDIIAPSSYDAYLLEDNYKNDFAEALFHAAGTTLPFRIVEPDREEVPIASPMVKGGESGVPSGTASASSANGNASGVATPVAQVSRPPAINSHYTFENFIIGPQNDFAVAAALNVATNPKDSPYNPVFIFGPTGVGKTHLLHAIANKIFNDRVAKGLPPYKVVYATSENFVNEYMVAVRSPEQNAIHTFRRRYREADVLLVDDIQLFAGKTGSQEAFFYTFNELKLRNCPIILTSDRPASDITGLEDRLISRFQNGLSVDIQPPSFETRLAILRQKPEERHFDTARYAGAHECVAENISHSVRDLEGAVNSLVNYVAVRKPDALPRELVETILESQIIKNHTKRITAESIQHRVAEYFNIVETKMKARDRTAKVAFARQVAMYLCSELTDMKLIAIGEAFGGRDHGTVIHAKKTIKDRMDVDADVKRDVEYLKKQLSGYRS